MQRHHQPEYLFTVYKVFEMSKLDLSAEFCSKTEQTVLLFKHIQSIKP